MPVVTLYVEELKATMRGRFAWLGAAVVLLAVGGLATVGTQDTWLDGYGIIAYGLVPLAFIPLAAGFIASARASRFVESVFTAPVRRGDWLAAKILVLLTLRGRLLRRARADDGRLRGARRRAAAAARVPLVDAGPARRERRRSAR